MGAEPMLEDRAAQPYAAIRHTVTMEDLPSVLPQSWPRVFGWLAERGMAPAGAPFIRYLKIDMPDALVIDVGIPTAEQLEGDDGILCETMPGGRFAVMIHTGPYDGLVEANAKLQNWGDSAGVTWDGTEEESWGCRMESYITDPGSEPDPAKWQTVLAYKTQ